MTAVLPSYSQKRLLATQVRLVRALTLPYLLVYMHAGTVGKTRPS